MTISRAHDVLLLGAAGSSGRLLAREMVGRGLTIQLAGRRLEPLTQLTEELAGFETAVDTVVVDVTDSAELRAAAAEARLVVTAVGPFVRYGAAVLDACLAVGACYVDIANEFTAVRDVLGRSAQAEACAITAVTAAGFGSGGIESLVLGLVEELKEAAVSVQVATVPANSHASPGVRETIAAMMPIGALTYVDGELVRAPFGTGATMLSFAGTRRTMLPVPTGDLEVARLISGAANVTAYSADPTQRVDDDGFSYAYAEVITASGRRLVAEARVDDGVGAGAAFAAEVARRVLVGVPVGAWTPGQLFGKDLFPTVTDATVTPLSEEPV
ncbi:saccharopine dehydrogenase NADP-binding domain-containing protein [Kribbella sp. NBC_00359]|uniref:saccharopine dehydrogenase NADP-binding domain-containing protein n=1 Tax=Kribbella sp. NBC_00359 TaxID=2975966 RepID=UPI002E20EF7C